MTEETKPKRNDWVPWLALGVSALALVVSAINSWITYQQSPLSGRYAPKLTASAVTMIYRLQGRSELNCMGMMGIENSGKGPARDVYFGVQGMQKDASAHTDGAECKLVMNEDGNRLYHVPLLPMGAKLTFHTDPKVMPDKDSYPSFSFVNSSNGPVPFDMSKQQETIQRLRALQVQGLPDFHGKEFVEPVQFVGGQVESLPSDAVVLP